MSSTRDAKYKEKYLEVLKYFLDPTRSNNATLGRAKLMKLLYYADFDHYEQYGDSITGDVYVKRPYGPVPRDAQRMLFELENTGQIKQDWENYGGYRKAVYKTFWESPHQANPNLVSAEERTTLQRVVDTWRWHSAKSIVLASHGEPPWKMVELGEIIPYGLVMYRQDLAPDDDEDEGFIPLSQAVAP